MSNKHKKVGGVYVLLLWLWLITLANDYQLPAHCNPAGETHRGRERGRIKREKMCTSLFLLARTLLITKLRRELEL